MTKEIENDELKPCPWPCDKCLIQQRTYFGKDEVRCCYHTSWMSIAEWNARATPQPHKWSAEELWNAATNCELMWSSGLVKSDTKDVFQRLSAAINSRDLPAQVIRTSPLATEGSAALEGVAIPEQAALTPRVIDIITELTAAKAEIEMLREANAAAVKDRERLDWIERNRVQLNCSMGAPGVYHYQVGNHPGHSSFRAAIDARIAMKLSIDK